MAKKDDTASRLSRVTVFPMKWLSKILRRRGNESGRGETCGQPRAIARVGERPIILRGDKPIRSPEDDALGRTRSAQLFAEHLMLLDASEGAVVGVLGPWGSGKTSFINLVSTYLRDRGVEVLDFNPWLFSGTDQLVESFFIELSAQLKLRAGLSELGKALEDYGELFSGLGSLPLVGPWIEGARLTTKIIARLLQRRKEGVGAHRAKVEKALSALEKPIVVFLDDIDRLTTSEIRDIFKLVRLTANFPNVIYVLAFDRLRVEKALTEQGLPGRDYLEKILQVSVDLPAIPAYILTKQILEAIDEALSAIDNPGPFHKDVWPDIFMEVIRPLLKNMRDVRRYVAAIYGTVRDLNGQVALADVLALEAIRVLLPDVFYKMPQCVDSLTTTSDLGFSSEDAHLKEQIDQLIEAAGPNADVVRALIRRLFPAAERHIGGPHYGADWKDRWIRERRVAHEDILRLYLERFASRGFQAFTHAEQAWIRMADRKEFDRYLRSIEPELLEEVIGSLEAFEDQFRPEHVEPGVIVLLNLLPHLPERRRGVFDLPPELVVTRVVLRLLRSLEDPHQVEAAVRNTLHHLSTLYAKERLIRIVGYQEGVGHKLVSKDAAKRFEAEWRNEVRSAPVDVLCKEEGLLWILLHVKREADPAEPPLDIPDSPCITLGLLRSARHEVVSQPIDSRAVRRSARLAWDALVELLGDEKVLRERIEKLKAIPLEGMDEQLVELADKYLAGWRPSDLDDDLLR